MFLKISQLESFSYKRFHFCKQILILAYRLIILRWVYTDLKRVSHHKSLFIHYGARWKPANLNSVSPNMLHFSHNELLIIEEGKHLIGGFHQ